MDIENVTGEGTTYFIAMDDGQEIGKADYYVSPTGDIVITYVGIHPDLRGMGKGDEFIGCIVDYARGMGVCVKPVCPFARSVFTRHPEYKDVL